MKSQWRAQLRNRFWRAKPAPEDDWDPFEALGVPIEHSMIGYWPDNERLIRAAFGERALQRYRAQKARLREPR